MPGPEPSPGSEVVHLSDKAATLKSGHLSVEDIVSFSSGNFKDVLQSAGMRPLLDSFSDGKARKIEPEVFMALLAIATDSESAATQPLREQYAIVPESADADTTVTVRPILLLPVDRWCAHSASSLSMHARELSKRRPVATGSGGEPGVRPQAR